MGIESYTVINRYNGKKFRFEVFLNNVVSTTPKISDGHLNDHIVVSVPQPTKDGLKNVDFIFYYENTTEPNGLEVVVPVKKHEKKEFFRAIEEQLMYIPNVVFQSKDADDVSFTTQDIAAKILYRDDDIVISESTVFDFPHILLGTGRGLINYGAVDFEALELEKKQGAVGLILDINDVEVTPPREAIVWSTKTRKAIIEKYNRVTETATKMINQELKSATDYLDWLQKAASIKNALVTKAAKDGSVLQKLSGIIDASSVNKIYYKHNGMDKLFVSDMDEMMGSKVLVRKFTYDKYGRKVNREKIKSVNSIAGMTIYVTDQGSDKYRDRYLYEHVEKNSYIVIKLLENWSLEKTSNFIGKSSIAKNYNDIVVPEAIMDVYLKEEVDGGNFDDDESASVTVDANRLAKLRKLEQKILFHEPNSYSNQSDITFSKTEVKISDIITTYTDTIVYGSFDNRELINSTFRIFPVNVFKILSEYILSWKIKSNEVTAMYKQILQNKGIDTVNTILISKDNEKHIADLKNFIHITDFVIESYKDGKITFNKIIRFALTMIVLRQILNDASIIDINKDIFTDPIFEDFYSREFLNVMTLAEISNTCISYSISPFYQACINYELSKDTSDQSTQLDNLQLIDKRLPDELCEIIDEVTDVHIIDMDLIRQVQKHCELWKKYYPILREANSQTDNELLSTLKPLIQNYEKLPEKIEYF